MTVALTAELLEAGIAGSIGTVGDALDNSVDNALCESNIGLFKTEAVNEPSWTDRREVEWQVARWVHWCNTTRLHSSIGHLPPIELERLHRQAKTTTPTTTSSPEVAYTTTLRRSQDGSSHPADPRGTMAEYASTQLNRLSVADLASQ